jgi:raffinose/stachyose/melibiose transport system permease protein
MELSRRPFWLFYILPGLLVYLAFMALPLVNSLRLSFFTGSGFQINNFIGFDNYRRLFFDPDISGQFWNAFRNTWAFFAITMLVQNTLGLGFALLLSNKGLRGAGAFRTLIFIPATIAIVVCGFLWKLLLDPNWGSINLLLKSVGLGKFALPWLGLEQTTLPIITLVSSWEWMGIPTMIFLAALQSIPDDFFEAAQIDGASGWQVFRFVKLPLLLPMVGVVSILTFTGNFNAFDIVYAMAGANGAPNFSADILGTYFYRTGIAGKHPVGIPDMGLGAAVAAIIFVVLLLGVLAMRRFSSGNELAKE